jgi:succinoglycan biosynthesis protein ExoO
MTVIERVLVRIGVARGNWVKPAPYSIGAPWTREDQLFLAQHAQFRADGVLADYGFLAPGIPYLLQPEAKSAVVMHDLFSSRSAHFERIGAKDSVAELDLESELKLLSQADAVVAIQAAEAALVRAHLPAHHVILAPMAVEPAPEPQPGSGDKVLFVGSKTAPNIDGIQWFFDEIWPIIRTECPNAELDVAGSVCEAVLSSPEGVNLLGFVGNLDDLYRAAAVVVSPLRAGSGLKVKLIEALGRGKAIVATPVTVEGVEEVTSSAVVIASDAAQIGASVVRLLKDVKIRQSYCSAALQVAVQHFSPAACYTDLVEFFREPRATLAPERG